MASITSLGSGSNLDLESLLTKLVSAEKDPQQKQIEQLARRWLLPQFPRWVR